MFLILTGLDTLESVTLVVAILSVAVAIFTVAYTTYKDTKTRLNQQRIKNMSLLLSDITTLLNEGDAIQEKISKILVLNNHKEKSDKLGVCQDEILSFSFKIHRYIRIDSIIMFSVWASDNEIQILNKIKKEAEILNSFLTNEPPQDGDNFVSKFRDTIDKITRETKILSNELKRSMG